MGAHLNIGPIDTFVTHYVLDAQNPALGPPTPVCIAGGGSYVTRSLSTFTTIPERVTCSACLEWMHA